MYNPISDPNHYNTEMAKSTYDKLGFVDKIFEPIDVIVDFGCADGSVTQFITVFFPDAEIIGYDLPEVLEMNHFNQAGKEESQDSSERSSSESDVTNAASPLSKITFTSSLDDVRARISGRRSLLVLNSVMHELYNYLPDPQGFIDGLLSMGFDYIWIRDIFVEAPATGIDNSGAKDIPVMEHHAIVEEISGVLARMREQGYADRLAEYEKAYAKEGSAGFTWTPRHFAHFLLKCRYTQNWDRELLEDYTLFGGHYDEFSAQAASRAYRTVFSENYVLPYVEYINRKDFGISLKESGYRTHYRGLFKKN